MASELLVNKITPESGTTLTLGESGDTISFASGVLPTLESLTITGDLTVDTNTLYVDSTNNRVGVGTTSPSVTFDAEADGATVAHFNRATSDGDILELQKDGTTVGSIGVASSDLNIYGDVGIKFSGDDVRPTDSSGNNSDNAVDLGHFDVRWQDLYLGGNIYLGGTGSANALDDYEEGTWTPVVSDASTGGNNPASVSTFGAYTKIGRMVRATFILQNIDTTGMTSGNALYVQALPFTTSSTSPEQLSENTIRCDNISFTGYPVVSTGISNSFFLFRQVKSALADSALLVSDVVGATSDFVGSLTYFTD